METTDNDSASTQVTTTRVKAQWRARLTAARAAVPAEEHARESAALAEAVAGIDADTVCAYVPFGSEPGSHSLLEALRARGSRVLLPVIGSAPGPLDWAEYTGPAALVRSRVLPVPEPEGPRLGPHGLAEADVVLVPALGVDHYGVRLGRGAGYYDRSLGFAAPDVQLVAVVRDSELVARLPAEPHDVRMTGVLTPRRGLVPLPCGDPV